MRLILIFGLLNLHICLAVFIFTFAYILYACIEMQEMHFLFCIEYFYSGFCICPQKLFFPFFFFWREQIKTVDSVWGFFFFCFSPPPPPPQTEGCSGGGGVTYIRHRKGWNHLFRGVVTDQPGQTDKVQPCAPEETISVCFRTISEEYYL